MTRRLTTCALALGCLAALPLSAAQAPTPTAQEMPHASPSAPTTETKVTGCLRAAAGGGSGFTLDASPAAPAPAAAKSPAGPPDGSPGTIPQTAGAEKLSYSLKAEESIGLAKHVNHRVEITGKLQQPPTANTGASTAPPGSASTMKGTMGDTQTLEVSALRMVSANCGQ